MCWMFQWCDMVEWKGIGAYLWFPRSHSVANERHGSGCMRELRGVMASCIALECTHCRPSIYLNELVCLFVRTMFFYC